MYFFWYFSSHLCWLPRYLCLNRSCLSYLLPPLPLSFWDATRLGGCGQQQPWETHSATGAPGGQRGPRSNYRGTGSFPQTSSQKKTPWREVSLSLSLKASSGLNRTKSSISQTCLIMPPALYFCCFLCLEGSSLPWGHPVTFQDPVDMSPHPGRLP